MHLTKLNYYSDFVVYPLAIVVLAVFGLDHADARQGGKWLALFAASILAWTLIEYVLHRFVFHHVPHIREMHEEHHHAERELLGTPVWLSFVIHLLIVLLPASLLFGLHSASAIAAGIMAGYLWYVSVHHIVHHWHTSHDGYLYKLKRRHALHHHASEDMNFGVTTGFWDRVFHTAAAEPRARGKDAVSVAD